MSQAKKDDKVKVHYTGSLEDGTVFDSSRERDPLEFTVGTGQVIPGFENGIIGMTIGDTKTVLIDVDNAYGQVRDDLIIEVEKDDIPADIKPEKGQQLQINQAEGKVIPVTIIDVKEDKIILDANHPLAGKSLTFEIELLEIS